MAYARFFRSSFKANLKGAAEYRGNFFLQVFGMILNNIMFLVFWGFFLDRTGPIGGYGINEVLALWGFGAGSFGLGMLLCGNVFQLSRAIVQGELDVYLLQPKDPYFSFVISRSMLSAWGDFFFGLGIFVYLAWNSALTFFLYLLFTLAGAIIFVSMFMMMQSLSFFWGNSTSLARTLRELLITASIYPETIFGPGMRWIFYSILPAGFISFIPLRVMSSLSWELIPLVLAAAMAYLGLSYLIFRLGLRRYESGNLIGGRI